MSINEAAQEYILRQRRESHPGGKPDGVGEPWVARTTKIQRRLAN